MTRYYIPLLHLCYSASRGPLLWLCRGVSGAWRRPWGCRFVRCAAQWESWGQSAWWLEAQRTGLTEGAPVIENTMRQLSGCAVREKQNKQWIRIVFDSGHESCPLQHSSCMKLESLSLGCHCCRKETEVHQLLSKMKLACTQSTVAFITFLLYVWLGPSGQKKHGGERGVGGYIG